MTRPSKRSVAAKKAWATRRNKPGLQEAIDRPDIMFNSIDNADPGWRLKNGSQLDSLFTELETAIKNSITKLNNMI